MKIVGINCSPRKNQTTQRSLGICLKAASKESNEIKTKIIELADLNINGCLGCGYGMRRWWHQGCAFWSNLSE